MMTLKCSLKSMALKGSTAASVGTATEVSARNLQTLQKQRKAETASAKIINDQSLNSNFIWDVFAGDMLVALSPS